VRLSPLCTSTTVCMLYQPWIMDDNECRTIGGMLGRGNRSTRRKPTPVLFVHYKSFMTWPELRHGAPPSVLFCAVRAGFSPIPGAVGCWLRIGACPEVSAHKNNVEGIFCCEQASSWAYQAYASP
jgi:hypothetical protein